MKLVNTELSINELKKMSSRIFGGLVKAVIDIKKEVMVVDASMHADEEKCLLDTGSKQDDIWGINLYPDAKGKDFIEFDSIINVRPRLNNFSRMIEDKTIRTKMISIVNQFVKK